MLDGVLHYRLERQRRHTKRRVRRFEVDQQSVFKLRLLDCEICAGVLQFVTERNHVLTGDGGEILSQIKREVKRDLLRLDGILIAKVIDTHHSIAYKDQTEHYYSEKRHAENNNYIDGDEHMHQYRRSTFSSVARPPVRISFLSSTMMTLGTSSLSAAENSSSTFVFRTLASRYIIIASGRRLPDSQRDTVALVTYNLSANSCCESPFSVRSFFNYLKKTDSILRTPG